jgi:glycosyltransferase involved in cell wall biosynthesis
METSTETVTPQIENAEARRQPLVQRSTVELRALRQPTIDVIVNNHDYGDYVGEAIDSALAQTYEDVRVVVVDDGSTDSSPAVIESYGSDIEAIVKENGGQASAFNAGLARSNADVIIFLDADDVLLPETCNRVAAAFEAEPGAARVQYRMEVVDGAGRRTGIVCPPPDIPLPSGDLRREAIAFPFDVPWVATSGNAFAAEALRRVAPIPEDEFRILADWYVVHLTSLLGPVVSLDLIGACRRLHDRNLHEAPQTTVDLARLRRSIKAAEGVSCHLGELARALGLLDDTTEITALSDIGNRLISYRLDRPGHPRPNDSRLGLARSGIRAALRRFDVAPTLRLVFVGWVLAEALAPRPLARRLADLFLFPERRGPLAPVLARLRRY